MDVESVITVLKSPSGQKAAIVVRREFKVALFFTESLLASRTAAALSRTADVGSTGMFMSLVWANTEGLPVGKGPALEELQVVGVLLAVGYEDVPERFKLILLHTNTR